VAIVTVGRSEYPKVTHRPDARGVSFKVIRETGYPFFIVGLNSAPAVTLDKPLAPTEICEHEGGIARGETSKCLVEAPASAQVKRPL
jgi:hypothetical protein